MKRATRATRPWTPAKALSEMTVGEVQAWDDRAPEHYRKAVQDRTNAQAARRARGLNPFGLE